MKRIPNFSSKGYTAIEPKECPPVRCGDVPYTPRDETTPADAFEWGLQGIGVIPFFLHQESISPAVDGAPPFICSPAPIKSGSQAVHPF